MTFNRRQFSRVAVAYGIVPLGVRAQAPGLALKRVGVLAQGVRLTAQTIVQPIFDELSRLGWVEGHKIVYDWAEAAGHDSLLPQRAADLVARKPDLIVVSSQVLALGAKRATSTIPVVFGNVGDPVAAGLVSSLSHPGGDPAEVRHVCMDMSAAYTKEAAMALPQASISYDRFHVIAMAIQAMDDVRREELRTEPEEVAAALMSAAPKTRRNLLWDMRKNPSG